MSVVVYSSDNEEPKGLCGWLDLYAVGVLTVVCLIPAYQYFGVVLRALSGIEG